MFAKPTLPITVYVLALVALVGLVSQFLAARVAFGLVSSDSLHPIFAALLIEAALVAEALEAAETTPLIRKGLGEWLAQTAARFTLTAGAGMVLEQVELTDTWREGIHLMLGIRDGGGRHGHGVSADADLAGG